VGSETGASPETRLESESAAGPETRAGSQSDVSPETAARPLPFFYDLYTFRGDGGLTTVVASFAVPAGRLQREGGFSQARYRFDVTFVLADTARRSVSRSDDSVYVSRPWPLDGDHLLHTHVEVQAPPSATTLQRVVMTDATRPGVGQLYRSPFAIPDYRGRELMLSDVALGLPGATSGWTRGDVVLALLPTSQFPESAFDVYYEIYNLPAGNPYVTEVAVEAVDEAGAPRGEGERPVRTFFAGESAPGAAGYVAELRRVESALPEGRYRLTVTVTDEIADRTATRSRLFQVRAWEAGATMVPALPRTSQTAIGG
jgi:hypothetical protein